MTKLPRYSRTMINAHAHDLSQQAYLAYKIRLTKWAEENQHRPRADFLIAFTKVVEDMSAEIPDG